MYFKKHTKIPQIMSKIFIKTKTIVLFKTKGIIQGIITL